MSITAEQCVFALKKRGFSIPAYALALALGTSSRAVATALRKPTKDGRVSMTFKGGVAQYRFKRLTAKEQNHV